MKKLLSKVTWFSLITGFFLGCLVVPTTMTFNHLTSTETFCGNSCHAMTWIVNDPIYVNSTHKINESGVIAQCKDCHLPRGIIQETWAHISNGTRDLIASLSNDFSDPKRWDARRQILAHKVRKNMIKDNSSTCRTCHQLMFQQSSKERVARQHELAQRAKVTCIQCHFNLVHSPVEPTDIEQKGLHLLPDYKHMSNPQKRKNTD